MFSSTLLMSYLFIHLFIFCVNVLKVKIINFFNKIRLLLKSCRHFGFQVASVHRVWQMNPDYSYFCMLPIDHAVTDNHQIDMFIVSENQPKFKGDILLLCQVSGRCLRTLSIIIWILYAQLYIRNLHRSYWLADYIMVFITQISGNQIIKV